MYDSKTLKQMGYSYEVKNEYYMYLKSPDGGVDIETVDKDTCYECLFEDWFNKIIENNTLKIYQEISRKTYKDLPITQNDNLIYPTLGLSNEVGEFQGKLKKIYRDKNGIISEEDRLKLRDELGDVLWYFTQICTNLNLTLEEIAEANLIKVLGRLERGTIHGSGDDR